LWKSLEAIKPRTVREFFGLAATQIRRTLIDLARYHRRKRRGGGKHATNERGGDEGRAQPEKADDTSDPAKLAVRTEFHESVGDLPQDLREVFGLLHYHGVTQPEAAALLGISERTVKRKWLKAKLALADAVRGDVTGHE
jgi:RNA polymerase sigma-70 factor (ECF subfamily)